MKFPLLAKGIAVAFVALMVFAVLGRIETLVGERRGRGREAVRSVEQSHAAAQTVLGPLLRRPCVEEWETVSGEGKERQVHAEKREFVLVQVPEILAIDGRTRADARYRGLFKVNAYAGQMNVEARFPGLATLAPAREHAGSRLQCSTTEVIVSMSDVRGVRAATLSLDGSPLAVLPGTHDAQYPRGLRAELPEALYEARRLDQPLALKLVLELVGTRALGWVPAAGSFQWTLQSDWPHPSFGGQFLPVAREVGEAGFTARWAVSALATAAPADVLKGLEPCAAASAESVANGDQDGEAPAPPAARTANCLDTVAVSFIDPVNPYVLSDRAVKYGALFIGLTFLAVALVEVLAGRRVHPVQYLLVGLSLSVFFLLLLSLSEHLRFDLAYAGAAAACAVLLGFYASFMFGRRGAGALFGGAIVGLYGLLYALLQMEQNALVIGATMLFAALACVMTVTRKLDWYAVFARWQAPAAP